MTERPERSEKRPAADAVSEVAPGVLRAELPVRLPGLGHVNCYLLEDEAGFAVVDPGLPDRQSWEALGHRLDQAGATYDNVHSVVVTHSHIDHYGNAHRLADDHGARVVAFESFGFGDSDDTDDEFADADAEGEADGPDSGEIADDAAPWDRQRTTPWGTVREPPPASAVAAWKQAQKDSNTTKGSLALPPAVHQPVADQQVVMLAGREWVGVHTPGHTGDHLCLYDPVEKIMLSGDHVLPTITPHIGGSETGNGTLAQFMDSLALMHDFDDVGVVLPAHGDPFTGLGDRADVICEHHVERLDELRAAIATQEAGSVPDFMRTLFRERSWGYLAERETYAHLEHLRMLGELDTSWESGILIYRFAEQVGSQTTS